MAEPGAAQRRHSPNGRILASSLDGDQHRLGRTRRRWRGWEWADFHQAARYPVPMRRWFVLALAPTGLLAANALVALSGGVPAGPSFGIDIGFLLALVLLAVEVISLAWLGGSLVQRWPTTPHEPWTLPVGVAAGFLPWLLLLGTDSGGAVMMTALAAWAVGSIALGAVVRTVSSRRAIRWTALTGGAVLVLLIPFLVVRAQHGADLVPWWSAPLWAPSAILGATFGPVRAQLVFDASLITMMVLFGSAMYLATVVTRTPSTVERIKW